MAALHFSDACMRRPGSQRRGKSQSRHPPRRVLDPRGKTGGGPGIARPVLRRRSSRSPFWKGQAWPVSDDSRMRSPRSLPCSRIRRAPYRNEAGFTIASLELALGKPDEAARARSPASPDPRDPALVRQGPSPSGGNPARSRTHRRSTGNHAGRRCHQPVRTKRSPLSSKPTCCSGKIAPTRPPPDSSTFVDQPQGQSLLRYHAAAIGLADALGRSGHTAIRRWVSC